MLVDPVLLGRDVPRGDGRQVLLLPGFGVGSQTLIPIALWLLNRRLAPQLPAWARPGRGSAWSLGICFVAYLGLAVAYLWAIFVG